MARDAARPAAVANGLLLFPDLAQRRDVGARSTRPCASATRRHLGREATPSAAILDSQTCQDQSKGGPRGYDAHKQVKRAQAASAGGHAGLRAQGGGLGRRRAGPRWGALCSPTPCASMGRTCPACPCVWADAGYGGPAASTSCASRWAGQVEVVKRVRHAAAQRLRRAAAPLDRGTDLQLVRRAAAGSVEGLRVPSRVERGADLRRHESPHAASAGTLACFIQWNWMTFKTVS